ncbi:MAG: hypothetical protein ACJAYG_000915 [Oceanicoccus sp.]
MLQEWNLAIEDGRSGKYDGLIDDYRSQNKNTDAQPTIKAKKWLLPGIQCTFRQ